MAMVLQKFILVIRNSLYHCCKACTWVTEPERVQQRDGPGPHGEHVAHDAADAGCRALIRFDVGGVVVALHLEDAGLAVADVDDAGVFAGAADHARAGGGKLREVLAAGLVGAMLGPHHREDAQFHVVGLAVQTANDQGVFVRLQTIVGGLVGEAFGWGGAHGAGSSGTRHEGRGPDACCRSR